MRSDSIPSNWAECAECAWKWSWADRFHGKVMDPVMAAEAHTRATGHATLSRWEARD